MNPWLAAAVAVLVAAAGTAAAWLSAGGWLAAAGVGTAVLAGGGWRGGVLLGLFFVSGSLLSGAAERAGVSASDVKGGTRDAVQVLANGLWAGAGALAIPVAPELGWTILAASLAAAQADTWATEIGTRSPQPPRLITTGEHVRRGTSGAVTVLGTAAGVAGAGAVALAAVILGAPMPARWAALLGGTVGMFVDSVLGATLQAAYRCERCGMDTERALHDCGHAAVLRRGRPWLTNDVVNFTGSGSGAAVGALTAWVWA